MADTQMEALTPAQLKDGWFRIWHIPNVPGQPFHKVVGSIEEAKKIINLLVDYDNFLGDDLVASNVSGLEVTSDGEWVEWHDPQTDQDIMELLREEWEAVRS
jgi:hypothetical protein